MCTDDEDENRQRKWYYSYIDRLHSRFVTNFCYYFSDRNESGGHMNCMLWLCAIRLNGKFEMINGLVFLFVC